MVEQLRSQLTVKSRLALVCAAAGLCIVSLWVLAAGAAGASTANDQPKLTPGAVFTSTNTVPNRVLAYNRGANGQLTLVQDIRTGGNGRPANNPPFTGFPVLDSMGSVNLSDDGDGKLCLFVVNAGSNSVSSFRVRSDGLELADQKASGGSRPASLTSTTRGPSRHVLYVLNSDNATASIRGFYVSGSCVLTQIAGSDRALPSQASVPATVRFDERGRHLAVSERFAPAQPAGNGDIVVYPVDSNGLTGAPVVTPSPERTPYGLDYNHHDILSVTNEHVDAPPFPNSTVSTYRQLDGRDAGSSGHRALAGCSVLEPVHEQRQAPLGHQSGREVRAGQRQCVVVLRRPRRPDDARRPGKHALRGDRQRVEPR